MRILLLNYEFPPIGGGGGNVTQYLGMHFAKAGHEVCLITSRYRDLPTEEIIDGIRVMRVPVLRKRPDVCAVHEMMTYAWSAALSANCLLRSWRPDIAQVFFGIPSGPVGYLLKLLHGTPYVVFLGGRDVPRRNPDPPAYRLWYGVLGSAIRSIWGHASAVVACSEGLRDLALRTAPTASIRVIPDGADLARFRPIPRPADQTPMRLLMISRLIPRKGVHLLLQAIPKIVSNTPFVVDIVGDGPEQPKLEQMARELGITEQVSFVGTVAYEELEQWYQRADVFVLCSYAEGMPLVVLEAMACGLPVVATRVQGIESLVQPGRNGYLFPPGNVDALAEALTKVLNAGPIRQSMGEHSVRLVQPYDWSHIAQQYLGLYGGIV